MSSLPTRVLLLLRFIAFLALVYLLLDVAAARLFPSPDSRVRGFFALLASPMTRAARLVLPPGASQDRARWVAIGAMALLWAAAALAS